MGVINDAAAIIKEESGEVIREVKKQVAPSLRTKDNPRSVTNLWNEMLAPSTPPKQEVPKYMQAKVGPTVRTMDEYEKQQEKLKIKKEKLKKEEQDSAVRNIQESAEKRAYGVSG